MQLDAYIARLGSTKKGGQWAGQWAGSLKSLLGRQQDDRMLPLPSIDTVSACIHQRSLPPLRSSGLYSSILDRGLCAHKLLASNLILFLAGSGNVSSPQQVFEILPVKADSCWAPLINGYINRGMHAHALASFKKMPQGSPHLDSYAVVSLLKICAELKDIETGSIIHFHAAKSQLYHSNAYVDTALLHMYAKCGALAEVHGVFSSLVAPKTVTWNALLAGHVFNEQCKEATHLYDHMQVQHVLPDSFTYTCVLKACASLGDSDKGSTVYDSVIKTGLLNTNHALGNAVVFMYSKCGLHSKAKELLKVLPMQSVVSWNGLIAGCIQHNYFEEVLVCYDQMQAAGIPPNDATYACALKACGKLVAIDKGRVIHGEIKREGLLEQGLVVGTALADMYAKFGMLAHAYESFSQLLVRDIVAWSALISGYTNHMQAEKALDCFELMELEGTSPNAITYACYLKACGILGAVEKGERIRREVELEGLLKTDQVVGNALVDMYVKCGVISKAWEVFKTLPFKNVITWTSLISGYAQIGETSIVFSLLERMRGDGLIPNSVTFLCVLYACSHAGVVDSGRSLFEAMTQQFGIIPARDHMTCFLDLLSRAGQLEEVTNLSIATPSHLDTVACFVLLGACNKLCDTKLGRDSFDLAMQLDETKTAAYLCMHNIYATL